MLTISESVLCDTSNPVIITNGHAGDIREYLGCQLPRIKIQGLILVIGFFLSCLQSVTVQCFIEGDHRSSYSLSQSVRLVASFPCVTKILVPSLATAAPLEIGV